MNPRWPTYRIVYAMRFKPLAFLAAMALAACTHHAVPSTPLRVPSLAQMSPQNPCDPEIPGLPNFGFVTPDVWRGGAPTAAGLQTLAKLGLKTVIDLREDGSPDVPPPGVRIVHLPVSAWRADLVPAQHLLAVIAANPKPVFIHCLQGRDRTGLAIAEYRLAMGMSAKDACRELRSFQINPWWQLPIERRIYQLQPLLAPKPPSAAARGLEHFPS